MVVDRPWQAGSGSGEIQRSAARRRGHRPGSRPARAHELVALESHAEPGHYFAERARETSVAAVRLGRMIDVGKPEALEAAPYDPVFNAL